MEGGTGRLLSESLRPLHLCSSKFSCVPTKTPVMPEGPEVRTICDALRKRMKGKCLLLLRYWPRAKLTGLEHLFIAGEGPPTILSVRSYGKKTLFYLNNGRVIIGSLGMEGSWVWKKGAHSNIE